MRNGGFREDLSMLTVTVEDFGKVVVLRCAGKIVHGDETSILCSAVHQESRNIVLDLTEVKAIDAAGIGALASLQAAGFYLKLVNPTRRVREILKVTKLYSILEICESQSIDETMESSPASTRDNQSAGETATDVMAAVAERRSNFIGAKFWCQR
jgi:anti-anti-sigma factor